VDPTHLEAVTHRENVLRGMSPLALAAAAATCKRSHPLSGDNLMVRPDRPGTRTCRECLRTERREYARRKRADAMRSPA
jgi:hypothetical protein